ncbi:abscisic acid-insensitive 5-like protein 2 [Phtheirospermum japonicum]|uniref:Abscisic acid-insensitive 5-like protein 2 n=1 Tax=Phtheirospermum japonicum TaxID=374723 RepID=A0A830CXA9_9LAMI|nr:abscisic acid-insensitive 5-like protein 2 [Phtheirospermum japonicum]
MVAQKMGSQRGGNNSIGGTQAQTQDPKSNSLARQGSLYSLTFAEMENQLGDLGKPLSSMNLDELLKTLFQAESNHINNKLVEGLDSGISAQQPGQPTLLSSLNRDPNVALSRDLSKKTVDEVWHDIQQDHKRGRLDRKVTLGEITLEDFLVKAGVVGGKINLGSVIGGVDPIGLLQQAQWMNYHPQPSLMPVFMPGHTVQQPIPIGGNPVMENQVTISSSPLVGTLSDTQASGRKRAGPPDIVEKSVERRQKRMIKNRESAARSRARKQLSDVLNEKTERSSCWAH